MVFCNYRKKKEKKDKKGYGRPVKIRNASKKTWFELILDLLEFFNNESSSKTLL